ncbi:23S rRNA (uracil(1939)-C(5))-methyltransferase RlmD [Enterocloster bolteae]|uniref:23S rRNA (uracil(1939)-C(5))-methyltransferase RlmD n=1 Tax=Enterocloster bolteae TaxID=208479 RepID=UPI0040688944
MEKNQEFIVTIEDMNEDGAGVGKVDGYIWFVKDAVIGDVVWAKAMKMKKSYGFARLMEVLEPSASRVIPSCPVARQCGGCQLQAMNYEGQLKFKERKVMNNLIRIGKFAEDEIHMLPIMGMEQPWRYRNKAQFPFGKDKDGNVIAGFYAGRTHAIVEAEDCLLGVEENREILDIVKRFMKEMKIEPYDELSHKGLVRHVLIRKGFKTDEIMVCLVINGNKLPGKERLVEMLTGVDGVKGMTSISYSVNQEKTNVIMGKEIVNLYGPGYITDYIGNVKYQISPLSFYQVNPVQTERLYGTALEYAGLTGNEIVWDLYCGIGTISLFLAQKAKKVYGVEIVPQAIEDARRNAEINGIHNAEFFVGKAEEVLPEQFEKNHVHADVIVVDPPRKGCDVVCLDTILKMRPERVVYVSCDSATLARDLRYLADGGYVMGRGRCCDMFPGTVHTETVVLLSKGEVDSKKIRVEFSLEDMDMSEFQDGATYTQIKDYVLEHSGLKVSNLYISQIKRKCGIEVGKNYNLPKSEDSRQPLCPPEKEKAIREAFKYFGII